MIKYLLIKNYVKNNNGQKMITVSVQNNVDASLNSLRRHFLNIIMHWHNCSHANSFHVYFC